LIEFESNEAREPQSLLATGTAGPGRVVAVFSMSIGLLCGGCEIFFYVLSDYLRKRSHSVPCNYNMSNASHFQPDPGELSGPFFWRFSNDHGRVKLVKSEMPLWSVRLNYHVIGIFRADIFVTEY
jgi:hypothetical protein